MTFLEKFIVAISALSITLSIVGFILSENNRANATRLRAEAHEANQTTLNHHEQPPHVTIENTFPDTIYFSLQEGGYYMELPPFHVTTYYELPKQVRTRRAGK